MSTHTKFDYRALTVHCLTTGRVETVTRTFNKCEGCGDYVGASSDRHNNSIAREGYDRCFCGSKYWENDRCVDCNTDINEVLAVACEICGTTNDYHYDEDCFK